MESFIHERAKLARMSREDSGSTSEQLETQRAIVKLAKKVMDANKAIELLKEINWTNLTIEQRMNIVTLIPKEGKQ